MLFQKTLIGGFSCLNTHLTFDASILLPNKNENAKIGNRKIIYNLKIGSEYQKKRVVSNILKMDENNQYGNAMTKPFLHGWIKKQKEIPSLRKLNFIDENISIKDKIGHLFIIDIKFNEEAADKKVLL